MTLFDKISIRVKNATHSWSFFLFELYNVIKDLVYCFGKFLNQTTRKEFDKNTAIIGTKTPIETL